MDDAYWAADRIPTDSCAPEGAQFGVHALQRVDTLGENDALVPLVAHHERARHALRPPSDYSFSAPNCAAGEV